MSNGFSKPLWLCGAGFAAGVVAVIACDEGPNAADAADVAACGSCEVSGPIAVRVPVCAEWEILNRSFDINYDVRDQANWTKGVVVPAPEGGWEPVLLSNAPQGGNMLFKRCRTWGAQTAP